jgi:hypothetical protein
MQMPRLHGFGRVRQRVLEFKTLALMSEHRISNEHCCSERMQNARQSFRHLFRRAGIGPAKMERVFTQSFSPA